MRTRARVTPDDPGLFSASKFTMHRGRWGGEAAGELLQSPAALGLEQQ
ncbi:MAG TPA: hypothetical protein VG165_03955 [Solirubrobacteraceae bacterium]|nr:hypothetical protein [Solirubrobacteraceae bacterium]